MSRPVESAQYLAVRYTERLAEAGAVASVGSKGDSYDNAMAEAFIIWSPETAVFDVFSRRVIGSQLVTIQVPRRVAADFVGSGRRISA